MKAPGPSALSPWGLTRQPLEKEGTGMETLTPISGSADVPAMREQIPTCSLLESVTGIADGFSMSLCGNYQCHYKALWSLL